MPLTHLWLCERFLRVCSCVRVMGVEYRRLIGQCFLPFPQGLHAPIFLFFFSKEAPMAVLGFYRKDMAKGKKREKAWPKETKNFRKCDGK